MTPQQPDLLEAPRYVHRVLFRCAQPSCDSPQAVWRTDEGDGSFMTTCEMHYRILERCFPSVAHRSRLLLDGEEFPAGYHPIFEKVAVKGHPGMTEKRIVGGKPSHE